MKAASLTKAKIIELNEKALELGNEAQAISPEKSTWGLYSYAEGPAGMSAGAFMWFESKELLVEFIKIYPFWFDGRPKKAEWQGVIDIADQFDSGQIKSEDACQKINDILLDPNINWIGTFQDLLTGKGEFESQIVARFHEDNEHPASSEVLDEEIGEFLEYIQEYGV